MAATYLAYDAHLRVYTLVGTRCAFIRARIYVCATVGWQELLQKHPLM